MPPFTSVSPICVPVVEPPFYPELAGKRVLVTGIASPEALSIARGFATQGCRLVLHFAPDGSDAARDVSELAANAQALRVFACDFRAAADIERFGEAAARAYGGVDIIVNLLPALDLEISGSASAGKIEQRIGSSLQSARLLCEIAAAHMCRRPGGGAIINVAAARAGGSATAFALQAIASTAIEGMTRMLAAEWGEDDIRVNALLLGEEPDADEILAAGFDESESRVSEAAATALYLATRSSRWLSGTTVRL